MSDDAGESAASRGRAARSQRITATNQDESTVEELRARLARALASHKKWSMVAADPQLPPEAAAWAKNIARSWAAVGKLARKGLAYEAPDSEEAMKDFPDSGKPLEVFLANRGNKNLGAARKRGQDSADEIL